MPPEDKKAVAVLYKGTENTSEVVSSTFRVLTVVM